MIAPSEGKHVYLGRIAGFFSRTFCKFSICPACACAFKRAGMRLEASMFTGNSRARRCVRSRKNRNMVEVYQGPPRAGEPLMANGRDRGGDILTCANVLGVDRLVGKEQSLLYKIIFVAVRMFNARLACKLQEGKIGN